MCFGFVVVTCSLKFQRLFRITPRDLRRRRANLPSLSYGLLEIFQPSNALNVIQFSSDPTKEVGVYVKVQTIFIAFYVEINITIFDQVNCISTEFTTKKHGGETSRETSRDVLSRRRWRWPETSACCSLSNKSVQTERDWPQAQARPWKTLKRPPIEQEKFQASYECTVSNDVSTVTWCRKKLKPLLLNW